MKRLFFLFFWASTIFVGCHNDSADSDIWAALYEEEDPEDETPGISVDEDKDSLKEAISITPSFHGIKTVNSGHQTRLADLGKEIYPELSYIENSLIGGTKLCAEMSADRNGNYYSITQSNAPSTFYSYELLGLILLNISDCNSIPNIISRVICNDISIDIGTICSNPDAWWGDDPSFIQSITITNNRPADIDIEIPRGTMLEVLDDDVQNVVVAKSEKIHLSPLQTKCITIKAMCAARKRSSPTGSKAKLTPLLLKAPSQAYQTQQKLWNWIESDHHSTKDYTITFYAWGVGDANGYGKSTTGHAFVNIPGIGLVGYGGTVTDHTHLQQYATLSASVKVSKSDLENAQRKYYEWLNNPGEYVLAQHDCTSFVMDIADAAHIGYGIRSLIQFPTSFVRAVKFYHKWD